MKALQIHQFQEYRKHSVENVGSAPMKLLISEGKYQAQPPFPFIPGGEAAGIISEVAEDVKHLKVGDRVSYLGQVGAFASRADWRFTFRYRRGSRTGLRHILLCAQTTRRP